MTDEAVFVGVKKMDGKSWWQITMRLGTHKYEWDLYVLGARFRIATLEEQVRRLQRDNETLQEQLYECQDEL